MFPSVTFMEEFDTMYGLVECNQYGVLDDLYSDKHENHMALLLCEIRLGRYTWAGNSFLAFLKPAANDS